MKKNTIYLIAGVAAVAIAVGYFAMRKKSKENESTSGASGSSSPRNAQRNLRCDDTSISNLSNYCERKNKVLKTMMVDGRRCTYGDCESASW